MQASNNSNNADIQANDQPQMDLTNGMIIIVINTALVLFGTFGNLLIIIAILKTSHLRRSPSNNLLLSLAVADLTVTVVGQPLYIASIAIKTFHEVCNVSFEKVFSSVTPLSAICSAFHLGAISIDRAISASEPHRHVTIMKKWSKIFICFCWGGSAIIGGLFNTFFHEISTIVRILLVISFAIMVGSYATILYQMKRSANTVASSTAPQERAMERRVSWTVAIVIILFAVCWLPLVVYSVIIPIIVIVCNNDIGMAWIRTLLMANSSMNFIVYSLRIRQFRVAYLRLISKLLLPLSSIVGRCLGNTLDGNKIGRIQLTVLSFSNSAQESREARV